MLIVFFVWAWVYFATNQIQKSRRRIWVAAGIFLLMMYFSMLVRRIDVLDDPLAYLTSGEFEPFRFAIYLIEQWLKTRTSVSPWEYVVPFVSDHRPIGSVNGYFTALMFGEAEPAGNPTVTIFATLLYFGFVFPLIFYSISVFLVKQSAYWLERSPGYYTSLIYGFFLLKLLIIIRNGELLNSLVDTIVLCGFAFVFHVLVGWRYRLVRA